MILYIIVDSSYSLPYSLALIEQAHLGTERLSVRALSTEQR